MVVLGGMGSISGAVVGAIIMTMVPELLRPIEDGGQLGPLEFGALYGISNIILAVGFILIMIFRPQDSSESENSVWLSSGGGVRNRSPPARTSP